MAKFRGSQCLSLPHDEKLIAGTTEDTTVFGCAIDFPALLAVVFVGLKGVEMSVSSSDE